MPIQATAKYRYRKGVVTAMNLIQCLEKCLADIKTEIDFCDTFNVFYRGTHSNLSRLMQCEASFNYNQVTLNMKRLRKVNKTQELYRTVSILRE